MTNKNNGFRDGKKEEIIENLSEEEKTTIKEMREYNERKLENKYATSLFVLRDQAYCLMQKSLHDLDGQLISLLKEYNVKKQYEAEIEEPDKEAPALNAAITTKKFDDGTFMTVADVKVSIMQIDHQCKSKLNMIRALASDLYRFVGSKRLDGEVLITEAGFNEKIESIIEQLKETSYVLF